MRSPVLLGGLMLFLTGCSKTISVTSEPPGADIYLNDRPTGLKTPAEVNVTRKFMEQTIDVRLPNYQPEKAHVEELGRSPCQLCWATPCLFPCLLMAADAPGSEGSLRHGTTVCTERLYGFSCGSHIPSKIHVDLVPIQTFASIQKEIAALQTEQGTDVKTIKSEAELSDLFFRLSAGGKWVAASSYPRGRVMQMPDGTTLGLRSLSKSGTMVMDLAPPPGHLKEAARSGKDKPYCIYSLVMLGVDDWVQTPKVAEIAAQVGGAATPDQIRDLSLRMIRAAVRQGLVEIGDVTINDHGFRKWDLPSEEALQRVEREWTALGRIPNLGEICWLRNTEKGDEMGKRLLQSSPSKK